jgi:hypothetical protein
MSETCKHCGAKDGVGLNAQATERLQRSLAEANTRFNAMYESLAEKSKQLAAANEELKLARGVIAADDERLFQAADRVGVTRSCDAADEMADIILGYRQKTAAESGKGEKAK